MQQTLIILLHNEDLEHPSWVISSGQFSGLVCKGNPEKLAELAEGREVIVIVPGEDVLLTTGKLPKISKSRLLQALPYALEEQVIADVETLHFAASEYRSDSELPVAIVAIEKMQRWMQLLQDWQVYADKLIPEYFCLDVIENVWQFAITNKVIIRLSNYQGLVCEIDNVSEICQIMLAQSKETPQSLLINYYTPQAQELEFNAPFEIREQHFENTRLIEDFAKNVMQSVHINLLQGQFAAKKSKFSHRNRLWQLIAGLAIAWVALIFIDPMISNFMLKQRVNKLEAQISAIYKQNFPNSTSIVAPKLRMEEKLNKLSSVKGSSHLLRLLAYVGNNLEKSPNVLIKRFDFQNNQLSLEVSAASSEDFSNFTENLQKQGLSVQQQNANLVGTRINAGLLIE